MKKLLKQSVKQLGKKVKVLTPGEIADYVVKRIATGPKFISFTYTKPKTDEVSQRTVLFGANAKKKLEKMGTPVQGIGNWASNDKEEGTKAIVIRKNSKVYLHGFDESGTGAYKIFDCEGISNLR